MIFAQDQLKAFFEVARLGSFTKAADFLGLTQSALSHRIKNLESSLETVLLIRDPKALRPTEAGTKLLRYCRIQMQVESEVLQDLKKPSSSELAGFLRVGGISSLMWSVIIPALGEFLRENSDVQLEAIVREVGELPAALASGQIDFLITCERLNQPHLEEHYLGDERNVLIEPLKLQTNGTRQIIAPRWRTPWRSTDPATREETIERVRGVDGEDPTPNPPGTNLTAESGSRTRRMPRRTA